jgi:hypothetical protein
MKEELPPLFPSHLRPRVVVRLGERFSGEAWT